MSSFVNRRGQITLDRLIRRRLGIQPGMVAHQRMVDGHLEVTFLPAPHRDSLYGALHVEGEEPRVLTSEDVERAVIEAIAAEQDIADQ